MSDFHFGYDNDLWVYPPLDDDYEMAEWLEAVEIDGQLFVDADDAITQVRAFQAENAKLRELVEVLINCGRKYHTMSGSCPMFDADAADDDFCGAVEVARKLGIEVVDE